MARRRLTNESSELPEEIIQHIQSFLKHKESAQTSLLSKSWYKAWYTRNSLHFLYSDFNDKSRFWEFVTQTLHKHRDLNINVDKLVLEITSDDEDEENEYGCYDSNDADSDDDFNDGDYVSSLVDEFIDESLKFRINVLELVFQGILRRCSYVLPAQVFEHEHLTKLSIDCCEIDRVIPGKVHCSNLASLILGDVKVEASTFKKILVGCPMIEYLNLFGRLRGVEIIDGSDLRNLKTLIVDFALRPSGIVGQFINLSRLVLRRVKVDDIFFTNLSSSFPKLEDLSLEGLYNHPNIQISSHSLKSFSLTVYGMLLKTAILDVPNIRIFKFIGIHIPPISFTASSNEWRSEIRLTNYYGIDWLELSDLLVKLGRSKIALYFTIHSDDNVVHQPPRNLKNIQLPMVEELTCYMMHLVIECSYFVECLLRCRPKLVYFTYCPDTTFPSPIPILYKKLIEMRNHNGFIGSTEYSSLCINDLKEVNVEFYEQTPKGWQLIKAFSDDSEILNNGAERIRFKLKWGSLRPEHTIIKFVEDKRIYECTSPHEVL